MKGQQPQPIGSGALGEEPDAIALRQGRFGLLDDGGGVVTPLAVDKQRAGFFRQPTDDGPSTHIRFGNEAHRTQCVNQPDIQP